MTLCFNVCLQVLSGSEEGSITVWDLRNSSYPASYLTAHESAISEMSFHPTEPTKLFTASEGGELYQWSQSSGQILDGGVDGQLKYDESEHTNPWLSGERIKNKIIVMHFHLFAFLKKLIIVFALL